MAEAASSDDGAVALLRGKLGAARVVLEGMMGADVASHDAVSKAQANAFMEAYHRVGSTLDASQRSTLQTVALKVPFSEAHMKNILTSLAGPSLFKTGGRKTSQDWEAFLLYLDDSRWDQLLDQKLLYCVKDPGRNPGPANEHPVGPPLPTPRIAAS